MFLNKMYIIDFKETLVMDVAVGKQKEEIGRCSAISQPSRTGANFTITCSSPRVLSTN